MMFIYLTGALLSFIFSVTYTIRDFVNGADISARHVFAIWLSALISWAGIIPFIAIGIEDGFGIIKNKK